MLAGIFSKIGQSASKIGTAVGEHLTASKAAVNAAEGWGWHKGSKIEAGMQQLPGVKKTAEWMDSHVGLVKAGVAAVAGGIGYGMSEGTTSQKLERGIGWAAAVGMGMSPSVRKMVGRAAKSSGRSIRRFGPIKGSRSIMYRAGDSFSGASMTKVAGIGALAGGMYGAMDSDTSILSGMAMGAGIGFLGKGATRAISAGNKYGMRTGAAAGGAVGMLAGGPVGMAMGAGIGGGIGGGIRGGMNMYAKLNRMAPGQFLGANAGQWAGGAALTGAISGGIIGMSGLQAYGMYQSKRDTNFGADGDLALGLHALRHG